MRELKVSRLIALIAFKRHLSKWYIDGHRWRLGWLTSRRSKRDERERKSDEGREKTPRKAPRKKLVSISRYFGSIKYA